MPPAARALLVLAVACLPRPAMGHPSPGQPFDRVRLVERVGGGDRFVAHARWTGWVGVPSPLQVGARVAVSAPSGSGESVVIELAPGTWRAGRTWRGRAADGAVRAALRVTRHGGRFSLSVRGGAEPVLPPGAGTVGLLVVVGDVRWCAEATLEERGRRLRARSTTALAACPCEPLPADTFAAIEQRIFGRHTCTASGCHGTAPGQAGLLLTGGAAYDELVGVPSLADPMLARVAPGDPEHSMLWRKLSARTDGTPEVPGRPMPIGDPALGQAELEAVRQWILAGAPATGTVPAAQPLLDCTLP